MTRFEPYGPFRITANNRRIMSRKSWKKRFDVADIHRVSTLKDAHGCYIFATCTRGGGLNPWYVGQAKKNFGQEVFSARNLGIYNDVLHENSGYPAMFFLAKMQRKRDKFATRRADKKVVKDLKVDDVEKLLIGLSVEENRDLMNVHGAKRRKDLSIPGITKGATKRGPRVEEVRNLQKLLGLDK